MQRKRLYPKTLALAAVVAAAGLALAHGGAAHANPSGGSTSTSAVGISGSSYQQLASTTVTTQVSGPISATGTVDAYLTGDDQWDTASCFPALDGTPFGPQVEQDLTSQNVVYGTWFDNQNRDAQLRERNLQVIGFSPSVRAGEHIVSLECAVSHGSDTVMFQGATTAAFSEPATGSIVNGASIHGSGLVPIATTTVTTTWTGPIVVSASASAALQGNQQWDLVWCQLASNPQETHATAGWPDVKNRLSSQQTGYAHAGATGNRNLELRRGGLAASDMYASLPPGTYTFELDCAVQEGTDTVSIPHAGIIAMTPPGAGDSGAVGRSSSISRGGLVQVASTSITTTASSSRLVGYGTSYADIYNSSGEWDTASCLVQAAGASGQNVGPMVSATLSTQGDWYWVDGVLQHEDNLYTDEAPLNPALSAVVPAGTYTVGVYCQVAGSDTVKIDNPRIAAFALPINASTPPTPLTTCGPVPATSATYFSDPGAYDSWGYNNSSLTMRKELTGYPAYGADGKADILYTGQAATWTFTLPAGINSSSVTNATVKAEIAADDHTTNLSDYTLREWTNGDCRFNGPAGVQHGAPYGGPFTNWTVESEPSTTGGSTYTVTLANTGGDWYAIDWIELDLTTQ